jgi:hypothetical protein
MHLWQVIGVNVADIQVTVSVRAATQRLVAKLLILKQRRNCIEPEARHAAIQPEATRVKHRLLDRRIAPVQVWLLLVKLVIVELFRLRVVLPRRAAKVADPVVRRYRLAVRVHALGVAPDIPVALGVGL